MELAVMKSGTRLYQRRVRAESVRQESTASVRAEKVKLWHVSSAPLVILLKLMEVRHVNSARVVTFRRDIKRRAASRAHMADTLTPLFCPDRIAVRFVKPVCRIMWAFQMRLGLHFLNGVKNAQEIERQGKSRAALLRECANAVKTIFTSREQAPQPMAHVLVVLMVLTVH